jgi:hypothetical protein
MLHFFEVFGFAGLCGKRTGREANERIEYLSGVVPMEIPSRILRKSLGCDFVFMV